MFIRPDIFDPNCVNAAQSTRKGGVSEGAYNSLNLGLSTNDNKFHVEENRKLFFNAIGIDKDKIVLSKQVHSNEILVAGQTSPNTGYDGIITNEKFPIVISIADCTPVLIYDEKNHACAALHAGWRGTQSKIVAKALEKMNLLYGTTGSNCRAYIGTCIGPKHFEVGNEVAELFEEQHKLFYPEKEKYHVDLKLANRDQLIESGLHLNNIEISPYCTVEHNHTFFSHRRENGITGRMFACIQLR